MSIATIIAVVVNVLFVLVIIGGFFIGFWRGLKKSALNAGISVIGALVAFFVTVPITKALLGININGSRLDDYIVNLILNGDIKDMVAGVPSIETLIRGIPVAIASTIVFILATIVIEFLLYFVYLTFRLIFLRDKKLEKGELPSKKHRVWGGVIGAVKTLALAIFALMPLTSLVGLAGELTKENTYITQQVNEQVVSATNEDSSSDGNFLTSNLPPEVIDGIKAYNASAFAFTGGLFKLDDAMFDYLSQIKVDGEKVKLRSEISDYWKIVDVVMQVKDIKSKGLKYENIDFDKVEPILQKITKTGLYKTVVVDFATYVVKNYENIAWLNGKLDKFKDIILNVREEIGQDGTMASILDHDLNLTIDLLKNVCKSGLVDEISSMQDKSVMNIVDAVNEKDMVSTLVDDLFGLKIVRASAKSIADLAINAIIEDAEKSEVDTKDWDEEKWQEVTDNLSQTLENALYLFKLENFNLNEVLNDPLSLMSKEKNYNLTDIFNHLGIVIDNLRSNPLFVDSKNQPIIDSMLKKPEVNLVLPAEDDIKENDNGVWLKNDKGTNELVAINDYKTYFSKVLCPSMIKLRDSGMFELIGDGNFQATEMFKLIVKNIVGDGDSIKANPTFLPDIILPIYQVQPTKGLVVDELFNGVSGTINFSTLTNYQLLKNDLTEISNLLVALNDINKGEQTGIDMLLGDSSDKFEEKFKEFMLNIEDAGLNESNKYLTNGQLSKVIAPLLKAKSTSEITQSMFDMIGEGISSLLTEKTASVTFSENVIAEGDNQLQEICDIFENFLPILKFTNSKDEGIKFENILTEENGTAMIGHLLNAMEVNAYRNSGEDNKDKKEGIFKDAFNVVADYLDSYFKGELHDAQLDITLKNEQGTYENVNFVQKIQELEDEINKFTSKG